MTRKPTPSLPNSTAIWSQEEGVTRRSTWTRTAPTRPIKAMSGVCLHLGNEVPMDSAALPVQRDKDKDLILGYGHGSADQNQEPCHH